MGLTRFQGALLGLAAGDALGTTLEFTTPGAFTPITDMVGGGPFDPAARPVDRRHLVRLARPAGSSTRPS